MKILIPTDFSKNAFNAARFGANLAMHVGGKVTLLNAYQLKYTNASLFVDFDDSAKAYSLEELEEDKEKLQNEFPHLSISSKLDLGSLDNVIESIKDDYDLVVMGTKGRSGIEAVLIGSETAKVIGNTSIPVLAIPSESEFKVMNKLFFALDLTGTLRREEVVVIEKLSNTDIDVHLFHNYHDALEISVQEEKELVSKFQDYFPGQVIALDMKFNTDSLEAIEESIDNFKPDLVVAKAKHRNFLQALFHRSITERLSYHTKQPLLVLKG